MKIASAVPILLALLMSAAKADFILKYMVETSDQRFEETLKQTDTKLRVDFLEYSFIQSYTSNKATILIHTIRTYMMLDSESMRSMLSVIGKVGGRFGADDLKPTGKTETINGYETREFKGNTGGIQISVFVTENLAIEKKFEKTMRKWLNSPCADAFQDILAVAEKCSGFPIRIVYAPLGTTFSLTFESLEGASFDDREFAVPNDYTEMPLSGLLGQ
jgi:hypothetical protein